MVRDIIRDQIFLAQASEPATEDDRQLIEDLKDTLAAHTDRCVGMAGVMIGVRKQIIIVSPGIGQMILINPKIVKRSGEYETEEGCLSLDGVRKTKRYKRITVEYQNQNFQRQRQEFQGFIAQNIQHQIDHLNGIII